MNTIEIAYREENTQLDKLLLNLDGTQPIGFGGMQGCSNTPQARLGKSKSTNVVENTVTERTEDLTLSFLPNPVSYKNVQLVVNNTDLGSLINIEVISISGRTIYRKEYKPNNSLNSKIDLDFNDPISGVFYVRVTQGSSMVQKRLIIF